MSKKLLWLLVTDSVLLLFALVYALCCASPDSIWRKNAFVGGLSMIFVTRLTITLYQRTRQKRP